jgi:hypothetical protein
MATTKQILREQALRRIKGGNPSAASNVHEAEVEKAIEQVINAMLKPQYFETLNAGERSVEGCVLTTYESIPVTAWKYVSKCTLPAIPAQLPRNQGIHRVYNNDDVLDSAFIPATDGEFEMLKTEPDFLSTVLGQIAYKPRGRELIFNKDLTAQSPPINTVTIELVVADFTKYGDLDPIPLDANLIATVLDTVVKMFLGEQPRPQIIDTTSDTK